MEEASLRCNYSEGMFSSEYFINFKGSLKRGDGIGGNYLVMKERVIVKDEISGLVSIIIARRDDKTSQILIKGALDVGAGCFFTVPNEEIIFN